ncbi:MAG TPA: aminoacyl-tRNA hydrolase [Deferrisomatales bacterium]|nr:aminoacyl-tRNA hydrolase [Deferrisomatales bacterium]
MPTAGSGDRPDHLVVGLGNPGPRYGSTRHNIGFAVALRLAGQWRAEPWQARCHSLLATAEVRGRRVWLACPQTFMNRSGAAVAALVEHSGIEIGRVVVVHDDLDLPLGRLRIRVRGGHGGHNGVRSILDVFPSGEFVRLRLGIGRPAEGESVVDHVLSPFLPEEKAVLSGFLERAADAVESIIVEGPARAMNLFPS